MNFYLSVHLCLISYPFLRFLEHIQTSLLPASLLRAVHVLPSRLQRQAHENTFNPRAWCVQPKSGTPIMDKIELNISTSSYLLPLLLFRRIWHIFSLVDDGNVLRYECV